MLSEAKHLAVFVSAGPVRIGQELASCPVSIHMMQRISP
jgi:hypothetical protein